MVVSIILATVALAGCPDELDNIKDKNYSNRNCEDGGPNTFYVHSMQNTFSVGISGGHSG